MIFDLVPADASAQTCASACVLTKSLTVIVATLMIQERPIPDVTFYEARPAIIAFNGSESGELFLAVNVSSC